MSTGIALVGSGIFAKEAHLPAIQATPLLSLKAVYSRSLKSAKALSENLSDVELYSDDQSGRGFDELLKRNDVKAVIIALPILVQPDYIKKALSAGKHVLAEKPVAKDVATATELIQWTKDTNNTRATFTIAENFRFLDSFVYGSEVLSGLGRVLTFRVRMTALVAPEGKWIDTPWRNKPEYQGGFLLDGGVHFIAATRLLLGGAGAKIKAVSAFTAQLQKHLPPVDTLNSTLLLDNGSSGTLTISFGTTDSGSEYLVAAEKGSVLVSRGKVTVVKDGKEVEAREFEDESTGVNQEVKAWAESLESGTPNARQSPEEAFKDLTILEAALKSGEQEGKVIAVQQ